MLEALTSYESIRAILGLSTRELPDTLLSAEIYDLELEADVYDIGDDIYTDYTTATGEGTVDAQNFVRAMRIFASHSVAFKCTEALPLFSSKAITDGKAGVYRDGNSPYKEAMAKVKTAYEKAKRLLKEAYATYQGSPLDDQVPAPIMGVSSPDYDPVTGE